MKNKIIMIVISLLVGAGVGWYAKKPTSEVREKEVEVIKKDIVTVVKEVTRPDGSKEIVTTTTDKSSENKVTDKKTTILPNRDWKAGVGIHQSVKHPDLDRVYSVSVERRVFDKVWVGVQGQTDGMAGLSVSIEF